jgi:hypothetical protein
MFKAMVLDSGQIIYIWMLCKSAALFTGLKAFEASTKITASVVSLI